MQITNIEFSLGNKKETIKDLGKLNPDWVIDKILDKTGIETRYIMTGIMATLLCLIML